MLWVVGPAMPLLLYYTFARRLTEGTAIPAWLLAPGRHVLASLLVSNLIIFGLRRWLGFGIGAWWWTPVVWLALLAVVTSWDLILDRLRGNADGRRSEGVLATTA
jgi:hypothetical protein